MWSPLRFRFAGARTPSRRDVCLRVAPHDVSSRLHDEEHRAGLLLGGVRRLHEEAERENPDRPRRVMRVRSFAVVFAMVVSVALLHAHAWSASRRDNCGLDNPAWRPLCGSSYAEEFPGRYWTVAALLVAGTVTLSLRRTRGRSAGYRWRRALAVAGIAYLAIHPLDFTLRDWHGDTEAFDSMVLMLISFPVSVPLLPLDVHFFWSPSPRVEFPYLGGDPVYGPFSTALAARFVALAGCAYAQWFVVVPWWFERCRTWSPRGRGSAT